MKKAYYCILIFSISIISLFASNVFGMENTIICDSLSPKLNFSSKDFVISFNTAFESLPNSIDQYTYSHKDISITLNIFFPFIEAPDAQTELLADSLIDTLLPSLSSDSVVLDVGSGTGLHTAITGQFSKTFKKSFRLFSFDRIFEASQTTKANVDTNNKTYIFTGDLFSSLNKLQGKTSLIIANPPMMPSNLNELQKLTPEDIVNRSI
ncbi:MAG: methyltransferase [Candidatus Omnitrophica bacterium]|nr:methyltransferase [Candidatus Omnitrophota bacterium]